MKNYPERIRIDVDIKKDGEIINRFSFFGKPEKVIKLCSQYLSKKVIIGIIPTVSIVGLIDKGSSLNDEVFQYENYYLENIHHEKIAEKIRFFAEEMQQSLNPDKKVEVFKEKEK